MMASNGTVLPVYDKLFNLVHVQWNSSTTTPLTLDANGELQFTGYYGNYDCRVGNGPVQHFSLVDRRPADQRPWTTTDPGCDAPADCGQIDFYNGEVQSD